jgi:hypothetical protein
MDGGRLEEQLFVDDERTVFLDAVEESLRPLMRAVFKYGVSYQDLVEVMRALYTFAIKERYEAQGRPVSEARLAAMSGVTRGEIIKLISRRRELDEQRAFAARRFDQLAQLLGKWHDDPNFSTPYGAPLDLSLQAEGNFRTFDSLLKASGTELERTVALASLQATGCVEIHANKFVRCTTRSFRPASKDYSKITRLGRVVGALNSNFVHNLLRDPEEAGYFERTVISDFPLNERGRDLMLASVKADGEDFIDSLDKWISTEAVNCSDASGQRYGVTIFFFQEPTTAKGFGVPDGWGASTANVAVAN